MVSILAAIRIYNPSLAPYSLFLGTISRIEML